MDILLSFSRLFKIPPGHIRACCYSCWTRRNSLSVDEALCSSPTSLKCIIFVVLFLYHAIVWGPLQGWSGPSARIYLPWPSLRSWLYPSKTILSLLPLSLTHVFGISLCNSTLNKHNLGNQSKHNLLVLLVSLK